MRDVAYSYDATLDGLFSCVFESYEKKERPIAILPDGEMSLLPLKYIETDGAKADRVRAGIDKKAGAQALELVETAFLNGEADKALWIYRFIRMCFDYGAAAVSMRGDETAAKAHGLASAAVRESHLLKGFIRFTDYGDFMGSVIKPKHYVLPLIREHFQQRYNAERILIHDSAHGQALVCRPGESRVVYVDDLSLPDISQGEGALQDMWRGYYKAVTIESRINLKLFRQMLPLRFRPYMIETADEPVKADQISTEGKLIKRRENGADF